MYPRSGMEPREGLDSPPINQQDRRFVPTVSPLALNSMNDRSLNIQHESYRFDFNEILLQLKGVRDQMKRRIEDIYREKDLDSLSRDELVLDNVFGKIRNLVSDSTRLSNGDISSRSWFKIDKLMEDLVDAWSNSDMDFVASVVDRLGRLVFPEHASWNVFERYVGDLVHSATKSIIDPGRKAGLGKFLKIKTDGFLDKELARDWPLWTTQVITDVREEMGTVPFDCLKSRMTEEVDLVLIGVGGCGKSRTCYDLCRFSGPFCVFLDWAYHVDLESFLCCLPSPPAGYRRNPYAIDSFEYDVKTRIKSMLISRLLVLKIMMEKKPGFSPDDFFQLQQLGRIHSKGIFHKIYKYMVFKVSHEDVDSHFESLIEWANSMNVRVVLDESHRLVHIQDGLYHSSLSNTIDEKGLYEEPRSFLSFFARFLRDNGIRSVWAGVDLRIADIGEIVTPGRSDTESLTTITFTDFSYFTPQIIGNLLRKWVQSSDEQLMTRIANAFEGRPRIFMSFIRDLSIAQSDTSVEKVFLETHSQLVDSYANFWRRAFDSRIDQFVPDADGTDEYSVAELLIDLMCNDTLVDRERHPNMAHYYRSMVTTGLVMLSEDRVGGRGLLCEPLIMKAARKFSRQGLGRDLVAQTVINRYIRMTPDESIRGKAVESMCIVRIRECFWLDAFWRQHFPDSLLERIDRAQIGEPRGVKDCRTGFSEHAAVLKETFLTCDATHVVLTQSKQSAADVIYGFFSFHLKTKWTDVRGGDLVISDRQSDSNHSTIENTYRDDEVMRARVESKPWVRFCFEFPTNAELVRGDVHEIIERSGETVTITAGIESEITRAFFGKEFVDTVYSLTRNDSS